MYVAIIGSVFILLLLGLPVAFTLGLVGVGIVAFSVSPEAALLQIPQVAFKSTNDAILVSLPAFILIGQVFLQSTIGERLFNLADKWLRHFPGGLAIGTVIVAAFFAAIVGSSMATVLAIGTIASVEMLKRGYPERLAYGVLAAAGSLGILIPPSGPMILYGSMTNQSIERLFISGIVPGLLLSLLFIIWIVVGYRGKLPRAEKAPWSERVVALKESFWVLTIPVIILGGIYAGWFTPTEAASVSFVLSLIIAMLIYRTTRPKDLIGIFQAAAASSGMLIFIIVGALLFGHGLTIVELPQQILAFVKGLQVSPWIVIIVINIIYAIMGMFLESISILLITTPIFFPIITGLGFDPIWFCVITIVNLELGVITPPVGLNLFAIMNITERMGRPASIITVSKAAVPFMFIIVVEIVTLSFFPQIALWLPGTMK